MSRSETPSLHDGGWSADESSSDDSYLHEFEYLSSDDAQTDSNSTSEHPCEEDFRALEDAGHDVMAHMRETAWTDDLHRLYLDFVEQSFVRSLYKGCHDDFHRYTAEDVESGEEVESNMYEPERQIGGAATVALPVSVCDGGEGYDENPPPKRLGSSQKRRCIRSERKNSAAMEALCSRGAVLM